MQPAAAPYDPLKTKDISAIWDHVIERARQQGRGGPEIFFINVTRFLTGPNREANAATKVPLERIDGETVSGTPDMTAGQQLVDFITNVYHIPLMKSPARYVVAWNFKSSQGEQVAAPQGEIILPAPEEIQRARRARDEWMTATNQAAGPSQSGYAMPRQASRVQPWAPPPAWGTAPPGWPQQMPPWSQQASLPPVGAQPLPLPPAPPPGASPELVQQLLDGARYVGMYNERLRQDAERAATPQPLPADAQAATMAKAVVQAMAAMGFTPDLAKRLAEPTPTPTLTSGAAAAAADPIKALESIFTTMAGYENIRTRLFNLGGAPPKDGEAEEVAEAAAEVEAKLDPVMATVLGVSQYSKLDKKEDEGIIEYAMRWGQHNPELAAKGMAYAVERGADIARVLEKFAKSRVAANQQAAADVRRGFVESAQEPPAAPPAGRGWKPTA